MEQNIGRSIKGVGSSPTLPTTQLRKKLSELDRKLAKLDKQVVFYKHMGGTFYLVSDMSKWLDRRQKLDELRKETRTKIKVYHDENI